MRRAARGMTLIEILVVLVLIGIVMGIVGGNFIGQGREGQGATPRRSRSTRSRKTLDLYKLEIGRYPTTQEGLQALVTAPSGVNNWNGPYWKNGTLPKDPWGNEYKYTSPGAQGTVRHRFAAAPTARKAARAPTRTSRPRSDARPRLALMLAAPARGAARRVAVRVACSSSLIVLVIIAIVASVAVIPMLGQGMSNAELRSAARQLASGLRLARSEAVSQRRETFLVIDLEGRRFKVDRDAREHALPQERRAEALHGAEGPGRRQGRARSASIRTAAATAAASRSASGERKYEVDVDWLTGRVAILD